MSVSHPLILASAARRGRRAFTLIELLVVISIIVILLAVSIPTIRSLTKSNREKQAVNLLTTLLANARSTAIATHKYSGIVVYEYPAATSTGSTDATSYVQLITQSTINGTGKIRYFTRVPRTTPQRLPQGIQVAMLDDSVSGFKNQASASSGGKCRVILFDSTGQMALLNALATDTSLTDPVSTAWNINGTAGVSQGTSSPGLVVYDASLFLASHNTNPSNDSLWLRQNADVLIVNPYTGNIIR